MKQKHIFYGILTICILSILFSFSNQNGVASASLSFRIASFLHMENYHGLIRKLAHFSIYFALAFTCFQALVNTERWKKNPSTFTIPFCVLCACMDEFHQSFIHGRVASVRDVLIDCLGAFLCILLLHTYQKRHPKP